MQFTNGRLQEAPINEPAGLSDGRLDLHVSTCESIHNHLHNAG